MLLISWNRKEFSFTCAEGSLNSYWHLHTQSHVESEVMFLLDCAVSDELGLARIRDNEIITPISSPGPY